MTRDSNIQAPTPIKNKLLAALSSTQSARIPRPSSSATLSSVARELPSITSRTPDPGSIPCDSGDELLKARLKCYNLDYPQDYDTYLEKSLDEGSKWFSRKAKRKLNLIKLLPYNTETHIDHAKYLSHILVHLYIAIKSMDLEGSISISTKDLASIKNDVELALDTDFFSADLSYDIESFQADDHEDDEGDEEDNEVRSSGFIGKIMPRSATVISVNHWTNELKSCLKMKVDLPLRLRASLAKVYYYLALSVGQEIQHHLFISMFIELTFKFKDLLLIDNKLSLNHQPMLQHLQQFFPNPNPTFSIYDVSTSDNDKKIFHSYLKLALNANIFFSDESMREIFDWSLEKYSVYDSHTSVTVLSNCLPIKFNEKESALNYISSLIHISSINPRGRYTDLAIIELLGRISHRAYLEILNGNLDASTLKDYGVLTETQFCFILNKVQNNLRLDHNVNSFHGISQILTYSLTTDNFENVLKKITDLLSSLETFVHPSNDGPWTNLISRFIQKVLLRYHRRFIKQKEIESINPKLELTEELNISVFRAFKEIVLLGSQSKRETASNYYISSIGILCDLPSSASHELLNAILLDLYDSLTDQYVNSNHRLIVSLKQFTETARYMIQDKLFRVHITNILSLLINKIGTNDLSLTSVVFNSIVTIASFIQFYDLSTPDDYISFESNTSNLLEEHLYFIKQNPTSKFEPEAHVLKQSFIASTKIFKDIIKSLVDKYILLHSADLDDKLLFKFSQTLMIVVESLSDDIFYYLVSLVKESLLNEDLHNKGENEVLTANTIAIITKRDPSLCVEFFHILDKFIRVEIDDFGAGKTRNTTGAVLGGDKKLVLYLTTLSEVLSVSLDKMLDVRKELMDLLLYLFENITNPSLLNSSTYVIHKTLKNLTNVKLRENRHLQSEPEKGNDDLRWGLYQFSEEVFEDENLKFDWYIPSNNEVNFAIEIFETFVFRTLSKIDLVIADGTLNDLAERDVLSKNLIYLTHSLSGLSILFDPEFHSEGLDEEINQTTLQKRLMILKSLRESKCEDNEMSIDLDGELKTPHDLDSLTVSSPSKEGDSEDGAVKIDSTDKIKNENNMEPTIDIDDDKSLSSRALTPSVHYDGDSTSVMNPTIAFRELKLYNCNYFFGQTQSEKRRSYNYGHVHSLKTLIGHSLHRLAVALDESEEDNFTLARNVLFTLRSYFRDVGKESSFDVEDQLFIDYTFIKKVQYVANHRKPFTRTALGARLEKFHRQRVILHSTNRFQSKLDKILLKDIVNLATSPFSSIYQPAHVILVESMEKLIGSYGLIISEILKKLEQFISNNDFKRITSGLKILKLKPVFKKAVHDYSHIKKVMGVLGNALKVKDDTVRATAQSCVADFSVSVEVPSTVTIFDEKEVDIALRPTDKHIDLEISTVKSAKDQKRKRYYSKLEELLDFLITEEKKVDHWRTSFFYLRYIVSLQEYYEFPTRNEVLDLLIEKLKSTHPSLVRSCVKSFARLIEKMFHFASFDYNLVNSFAIGYQRGDLLEIDCSKPDFNEEFKKECVNYENPKFFIDTPLSSGLLFWGKTISVLKAGVIDSKLNSDDLKLLKSSCTSLTKEMLKQIFEILAQENETNGNFQESEVHLVVTIIRLIEENCTSMKFQEILDLITEIYDKDDKACVIIVAEIIAGLLEASAFISPENLKLRDEFMNYFFEKALLSDLTTDSATVWSILFWLVPSKIDFKRIPVLVNQVENLKSIVNVDSNLAFAQSSRISFACAFLAIVNGKYPDYEKFLSDIPFCHPYQVVRKSTATLLSALPSTFSGQGYKSSTEYLQATSAGNLGIKFPEHYNSFIIELFKKIDEENGVIQNLTVQDSLQSDYFYLASTMLVWVHNVSLGPNSPGIIPFIKEFISPFLLQLENNRELCKLGNLHPFGVYRKLATLTFREDQISDILSMLGTQYTKVHQILMQLSFIEVFYSRNLPILSVEQKGLILELIDKLLFHTSMEVRIKSSSVLSGIIHNSKDLELTKKYIDKYQKTLSKNKAMKGLSAEKTIKLHGSTLGIGALVSAFPYVSPPPQWLIENVALLARVSSVSGVVGKTAKDTLSNFKKLRADTWHIDRYCFTEEQLEDLEGVLWRSYFA